MIVSATRLPGNAVVDRHGEDIGRLERIMVDVASGRIAYVVLAYGGVFGLGERHCALAWEDLVLDAERRCFVLDRAREKIEERPLLGV
jgi:sporulation protein YlmC with PRC-barrel domain